MCRSLICTGLSCLLLALVAQAGCQPETKPAPAPPTQTIEPASSSPTTAVAPSDDQQQATNGVEPGNLSEPPDQDFAAKGNDQASNQEEQTIEIPADWHRMFKEEVWLDLKNKQVIIAGTICLNFGPLEMFVCPVNTKEHESVIAAHAQSKQVHAALLAIGFNPGSPCQWDPEYKPASGPVIEVDIRWFDTEQNKEVTRSAASMIRDSQTKQPMSQKWVFGGSQIWNDPETGESIYYGDSGEMICLSNFSTATIDLNVESSASNDGLLFEAFTENIPPVGTKVYVVIKPGESIGMEDADAEKDSATSNPPAVNQSESNSPVPDLTGPEDPTKTTTDQPKTESARDQGK